MCHLFLSISNDPSTVKDLIPQFLYKGTVLSKFYYGYGFAWKKRATIAEWNIYKSDKPYFCDIKSQHIVNHVSKKEVIIGHIRNYKSDKTRVEAPAKAKNTQPFCYKNHVFEHNGFIRNFAQHRTFLKSLISPKFAHLIKGDTDTEVMFYLLLTFLEGNGAVPEQAFQTLFGLFRRNGITGLFNIIYGSGNETIVITRYSIGEGNPIPLYCACAGAGTGGVLVSSIKLSPKQRMMGKNEIMVLGSAP